ncbi:hypothetical protein V7D15_07475 [Thermoanaerobacter thermohydrosulfuricus]
MFILTIPAKALASQFSQDTINEIIKLSNWIWGLALTFEGIWAIFNIVVGGINLSLATNEEGRKSAISGLVRTGLGILLLTLTQYITGFFIYFISKYYYSGLDNLQNNFREFGVKLIEITTLIAGFILIWGIIYAAFIFASPEGSLIFSEKHSVIKRERAIKQLTWTIIAIMIIASATGIYTILVNL